MVTMQIVGTLQLFPWSQLRYRSTVTIPQLRDGSLYVPPQQSMWAPLYQDRDYRKTAGRSIPLWNPPFANRTPAPYKVYDSFSHTYTVGSQQLLRGNPIAANGWCSPPEDQLLMWLSGQGFDWNFQIAVKSLALRGASFMLHARRDMYGVLSGIYHLLDRTIDTDCSVTERRARRTEHRSACYTLKSLLRNTFDGISPSPQRLPEDICAPSKPCASSINPVRDPLGSDFWRTLSMDVIDCEVTHKHRRCSPPDETRVQEWISWILNSSLDRPPQPRGEVNDSTAQIPQLHWHLNTVLQKKRMIRTKGGRLGLASQDVRFGDKVVVLGGEAYPYIMRRQPGSGAEHPGHEKSARYSLICPAYIHGLMDGQALRKVSDDDRGLETILVV